MKMVFWKWLEASSDRFTKGKEYADIDGRIRTDCGSFWSPFVGNDSWHRIERTCFYAHNQTWFAHTPGDPMPCDGDRVVVLLFQSGRQSVAAPASVWAWGDTFHDKGWRFADQEPMVSGECKATDYRAILADADESGLDRSSHTSDVFAYAISAPSDIPWKGLIGGKTLDELYIEAMDKADKGYGLTGKTVRRKTLDGVFRDESEINDLKPAAIEDSHLTPSKRRHWNEMEERQAQKEQAAAAHAELKKSEQAKALQEAADAMGKVNQDHPHRLGWLS